MQQYVRKRLRRNTYKLNIHSERIRPYKMQFISREKKRNIELKLDLPTFNSFSALACLCLTCMQCSDTVAVTTCYSSYTLNAMVSTQRDKDKGIVLALLLRYLRCFLFFVLFVFVIYLWGILAVQIIIHYMFSEAVTIHYVFSEAVTACEVNSWSEFLHPQVENKSQDTSKSDPVK